MKNRELIYNLARKYPFKTIWMETISAQRGMYLELRNNKPDGVNLPLREIPSHSGSKEARIEQLQPFYESGRIYHVGKDDKEIIELERELLLFGRTPHDDRSDCLSFAINKVKYPHSTITAKAKIFDEWNEFFEAKEQASWKTL
jgi:predicted phage terminase large subunit-like protein